MIQSARGSEDVRAHRLNEAVCKEFGLRDGLVCGMQLVGGAHRRLGGRRLVV